MRMIKLLSAGAALISASFPALAMEGNAEAGAKVYKKCAACHSLEEAKNKVGPHLVGIIDRPVASIEGFKYSKGMIAFAEGDKVWDEETLKAYLAKPRAVVKGTRMAFVGLKKDEDLANIIAYIKSK